MKNENLVKGAACFTSRLPRVRGVGRVGACIATAIRRRWVGGPIDFQVSGFRLLLDPTELVENSIAFLPQWYDYQELKVLRSILKEGDTFVDVGANVGMYTLQAARAVGLTGKVTAIEANPELAARLQLHLTMNSCTNTTVHNVAVSDFSGSATLHIQTSGNLGGSRLHVREHHSLYDKRVEVRVEQLAKLLSGPVTLIKLDIEGEERKAIEPYLSTCDSRPLYVLTEQHSPVTDDQGVVRLLQQLGYQLQYSWGSNYLLKDHKAAPQLSNT